MATKAKKKTHAPEVIETVADETPTSLSVQLEHLAHEASRAGDAAKHAGLHHLAAAASEFKRAIAAGLDQVDDEDLKAHLTLLGESL